MRVILIRHPRPAVADGICYGRSDLPLAEDAAVCAARLRPLLPAAAPLYSSPLTRCRQLAEALSDAPCYDERLVELDFGEWEMRAWEAIERAEIDAWSAAPQDYTPPRGESVAGLRARVGDFLAGVAAAGTREVVLVSHAGVLRACLALLCGWPSSEWLSARFDYGTASLIQNGSLLWHNEIR